MRYYIIAGERSGDLHGSNLVKALKKQDALAEFRGFGGEYMRDAGVELSLHYSDLAFMGFIEVIKNLNTISRYTKKCKEDILSFKPDVIILIDYAGFNMRIASFGKKNHIRVFYYISPKVWAWYQKRALKLKATVDRMFVILPFEKEFFRKFNWEVDYVGNPVLDAVKTHQPDPDFLQRNKLEDVSPIIALLPGSRKQELLRMIPVMADVAKQFPQFRFAVATVSNLNQDFYSPLAILSNVTLVNEDTYNLLLNARAAIVTSGTATLETALFKVPQVVIYRASSTTYKIVKWVIRVPYISLVNLIAGRAVIQELIQERANKEELGAELDRLVSNESYRLTIMNDYQQIIQTLDTGSASENAAKLMVNYLRLA
jgi:lipid-A-disaccharide synthase